MEVDTTDTRVARWFLASLLLSFAILAVGVLWTVRLSRVAGDINHRIGHIEFSRDLAHSLRAQSGGTP